jgi:hypothetical protein
MTMRRTDQRPLNALRAASNLPPRSPEATPTAQQDQLFTERAFWLFGTAHRMGDLRRLGPSMAGQ